MQGIVQNAHGAVTESGARPRYQVNSVREPGPDVGVWRFLRIARAVRRAGTTAIQVLELPEGACDQLVEGRTLAMSEGILDLNPRNGPRVKVG